MLSTSTLDFFTSAATTRAKMRRIEGRKAMMISAIKRRGSQHHPGERRAHIEQEGQQDDEREHLQRRVHQLAGEEVADAEHLAMRNVVSPVGLRSK